MGKVSHKKPTKLADKLVAIRVGMGLSQNQIIRALGLEDELTQSQISAFERGTRIPSLLTLLSYARIARISTDALIDDGLDLSPATASQEK